MAEGRRIPMTTEQRAKVSDKISLMMREEREKPKEKRRSRDQLIRIAYEMVREDEGLA